MSIKEKLANGEAVTIAFFGDSVTQGCFEGDYDPADNLFTYRSRFCEMLREKYPAAKIDMINAGIAGNVSGQGLYRMQGDVLDHKPNLCVVCFGINDSSCYAITPLTKALGLAKGFLDSMKPNTDAKAYELLESCKPLDAYRYAMTRILDSLQEKHIPVILLTPNRMSLKGAKDRKNPAWLLSHINARIVKKGQMDKIIRTARELAQERNIPVADGYARWIELEKQGVVTPETYVNGTNHPTRELHAELASVLMKTFESAAL